MLDTIKIVLVDRQGPLARAWRSVFAEVDESGDVDLSLIEYNLSLTPAERLRRAHSLRLFAEAARADRIRRYGLDPADPPANE